jgi:hypothetical protein
MLLGFILGVVVTCIIEAICFFVIIKRIADNSPFGG